MPPFYDVAMTVAVTELAGGLIAAVPVPLDRSGRLNVGAVEGYDFWMAG
jgi:hypothetical protein